MKEFEEHTGSICDSIDGCPASNCDDCEKAQQAAWKAALKWVLDDCECTGDYGQSEIDQHMIREELG